MRRVDLRLLVTIALCAAAAACPAAPRSPNAPPSGEVIVRAMSSGQVWAVLWPAELRAQLDAAARRRALVVVRVEGERLRFLDRCAAAGSYTYTPLAPVSRGQGIADTPEHGDLWPWIVRVGAHLASREGLSRAELSGECEGATHTVASIATGTFHLSAGGDFVAQGGDDECLSQITPLDVAPPAACAAVLHLRLTPLCPTSTSWDGRACAPPRVAPGPRAERLDDGMVRVQGGSLLVGEPDGYDDTHPALVAVRSFDIDVHEVTVAAYQRCVDAGACAPPARDAASSRYPDWQRAQLSPECNAAHADRGDHPVNCVAWTQARACCAWLGKRLPTATEWEYAARGPEGRPYPWGEARPSPALLNACGAECPQRCPPGESCQKPGMYRDSDGHASTAPVGSFPEGASPFGVLDMAGNAAEWTASPGCRPYGGCNTPHVTVKGGSYGSIFADQIGAASAEYAYPGLRRGESIAAPDNPAARMEGGSPPDQLPHIGFRCARTIVAVAE